VGERSLHTREVAGSKPAAPIIRKPAEDLSGSTGASGATALPALLDPKEVLKALLAVKPEKSEKDQDAPEPGLADNPPAHPSSEPDL
jgi:hypothetical protein